MREWHVVDMSSPAVLDGAQDRNGPTAKCRDHGGYYEDIVPTEALRYVDAAEYAYENNEKHQRCKYRVEYNHEWPTNFRWILIIGPGPGKYH